MKLGFVFDPRDIGIDERDDPQPRLRRLAQALLQEEPVSRELASWFADLVAAGCMQVTMPDGRGKGGEGNTVPKALRLAAVSMARERMLQVKQEREQEETLNQKQPLSKRKQAPRKRKLKPDAITKDVIVEVLAELKLTSCTGTFYSWKDQAPSWEDWFAERSRLHQEQRDEQRSWASECFVDLERAGVSADDAVERVRERINGGSAWLETLHQWRKAALQAANLFGE